ncbi:BON domain-containing protein [Burkholderia cenocepacia]|uniref:BON domain-containing protein n=1 Tax=Burkholderia TaxID=32008 RepID=UPI0015887811|nr:MULTISPECIES: BON domain-containing protein [Burkholderia]MBR8210643.1 BON domain-containing protein [Burkholderia cenocepacia]
MMNRISVLAFAVALVFVGTSALAQTTQVDSATQTASGVQAVSSAGNARKAARARSRKLAKDVRHAFSRTPGLNQTHIGVLVKPGEVTLTGTVPDAAQIDAAEKAAESVPGVMKISNRLTVHENGQ